MVCMYDYYRGVAKMLKPLKTAMFVAAMSVASPAVTAYAQGSEKSAGDWLVRGRIVAVTPDESSTIGVIGGEAAVDTAYMPELDIGYFFTDNIATELVLTTTNHDARAVGTALGDVDLGDVWLLPPTLMVQYHFAPKGAISPYIGAGLNLTLFYAADEPGTTVTDIDYSNSVGPALQAGVDFRINDDWMFNMDVKKVWLDTNVDINNGAIMADVNINPWVFGIGFGTTF